MRPATPCREFPSGRFADQAYTGPGHAGMWSEGVRVVHAEIKWWILGLGVLGVVTGGCAKGPPKSHEVGPPTDAEPDGLIPDDAAGPSSPDGGGQTCPRGARWDGAQCVDADECASDNGG